MYNHTFSRQAREDLSVEILARPNLRLPLPVIVNLLLFSPTIR